MERVLKRIFLGQISPEDKYYNITKDMPKKQAYKVLYEPFEEKLKALNLLREYENVFDAYDALQEELEAEIFIGGFQLGARVMLEVLDPHMVF